MGNIVFIIIGTPAVITGAFCLTQYSKNFDLRQKGLYLSYLVLFLITAFFTNIQSSTRFFCGHAFFYFGLARLAVHWRIIRLWALFYWLTGIFMYVVNFPWTWFVYPWLNVVYHNINVATNPPEKNQANIPYEDILNGGVLLRRPAHPMQTLWIFHRPFVSSLTLSQHRYRKLSIRQSLLRPPEMSRTLTESSQIASLSAYRRTFPFDVSRACGMRILQIIPRGLFPDSQHEQNWVAT